MKEHLQIWYDRWLEQHRNTNLLYVSRRRDEVYLDQVHFVRDDLARIVWRGATIEERPKVTPPRNDCFETAFVIGEHTSKSIRLPVYSIERPDLGIRFVVRDNFHGWNISVIAEKPVTVDLSGFDVRPDHCYFEGFADDLQFGSLSDNPCRFSLNIDLKFDVYTFVWLVMRGVRS